MLMDVFWHRLCVVLICHQYDVCKKICWQCVCWCVWLSELSGLSSVNCCQSDLYAFKLL